MPPHHLHNPLHPIHRIHIQSTIRPLLPFTPLRNATHASEGRANKASQGPGKRLGAKKSATELVVPGNIIFRQRGTHWFPGENCGMGRDHTIFAREKGYVTYYKDEERHPGRKYIGVVFERGWTLPRGRNEARRRRLGLVTRKRVEAGGMRGIGTLAPPATEGKGDGENVVKTLPPTKKGYMFRETNWEIGRAAEKAKVKVTLFKPGDRFKAWRKKKARIARGVERKAMMGKGKGKKNR